MKRLPLRDDASEIIRYNTDALKIYTTVLDLADYANYEVSCHWHDEAEFVIPLDQDIVYFIDGAYYTLARGDGMMVMPNAIHYTASEPAKPSRFQALLVNPVLFQGIPYLWERYLYPLLHSPARRHLMLRRGTDWENEIIGILREISGLLSEKNDGAELDVMSRLYRMFFLLSRNVQDSSAENVSQVRELEIVREMLGYIHGRFQEEMSLPDIAFAGGVCRSRCCILFKKYLHVSPKEYLQKYRIQKSIDYIQTFRYNFTEVALMCGFNSLSYFTETFHRWMGMPPGQYKKDMGKEVSLFDKQNSL